MKVLPLGCPNLRATDQRFSLLLQMIADDCSLAILSSYGFLLKEELMSTVLGITSAVHSKQRLVLVILNAKIFCSIQARILI